MKIDAGVIRFLSRIAVGDGCWEWQWHKDKRGYGSFEANWPTGEAGRAKNAHRYAYRLLVGPIPPGLTVDHLCRNRACVRPDHLEAVPMGVNVMRGYGPPARNARKVSCPQGHAYDSSNTHIRLDGSRQCRACGREKALVRYRSGLYRRSPRRNPTEARDQGLLR